jgi:CRISPR-associated protein Cmr1
MVILEFIEADFRVTTPLFLFGCNEGRAEFRIPSILGALRFWYRATAPASLVNEITKLRKAEAALFGSSDNDTGQSAFLTRMGKSKINYSNPKDDIFYRCPGITYLGYGLPPRKSRRDNDQHRVYIKEGSVFTLKFIFKPQHNSDKDGLIRAIKALGMFGGVGSRSRRGYGSLTLLSLKDKSGKYLWKCPASREQLRSKIQQFVDDLQEKGVIDSDSSYTAFSSASRVVISRLGSDPLKLLEYVGNQMLRYRSYGHKKGKEGKHLLPNNEEAKQIFADDHDLVLAVSPTRKPDRPPRRIAFGLPHNYFFRSTRKNVDITGSRCKRRGSPLLINIHSLENCYAAVLTYLPAQFLPTTELIMMKEKNKEPVYVPVDFDELVIPNFLDSFSDRLEVRP